MCSRERLQWPRKGKAERGDDDKRKETWLQALSCFVEIKSNLSVMKRVMSNLVNWRDLFYMQKEKPLAGVSEG